MVGLSDSEMRLQAVTFTTPPRKLKVKLWRASIPSPSRDQRQSPGTETVQRILQEAPTGVSANLEAGDFCLQKLSFPPTGYWFNLADLFLIRKISWLMKPGLRSNPNPGVLEVNTQFQPDLPKNSGKESHPVYGTLRPLVLSFGTWIFLLLMGQFPLCGPRQLCKVSLGLESHPLLLPLTIMPFCTFCADVFSRSVVSDSLQPHGLQHFRLACPSSSPRVCLNSCTDGGGKKNLSLLVWPPELPCQGRSNPGDWGCESCCLVIWVKDLMETKWAETSLVVQWLRLCLPLQGVRVWSLLRELRSHMSHGQKTKT